jgi:hypothetical protein
VSGLFEIFFSPGKVFDQVRERSMFLPALIAVIILSAGYFAVLANLVGLENMTRKQMESGSRFTANLSAEQKEAAIRQSGTPVRVAIGYCAATIGTALVLLITAGISLGAVSAAGGKAKYAQVLGAVSYAAVPFALLNLVMSAVIILAAPDRDSLDFNNLIATNIGAFLDKETTGKAVMSIAGSLDLISFAHIGLLAFGLSKVSRLSFMTSLMLVIGMWVIYVLGKAGLSAMF